MSWQPEIAQSGPPHPVNRDSAFPQLGELPDYEHEDPVHYPPHSMGSGLLHGDPAHYPHSSASGLELENALHYPHSSVPGLELENSIPYSHSTAQGLEHANSVAFAHGGIGDIGHVESNNYSQDGISGLEQRMTNQTRSRIADLLGHWKASKYPIEGQEGVTPYLYEQHFEKAEVLLDENNDSADTELIFDDVTKAYAWRNETRAYNPQTSADPTIPRQPHQIRAAVKLVFKAYKSVAFATDNAGMLKAFQEQRHDNRQVEATCWSIVIGCIDRCDRGPLLNAYEPEKAKNTANIKSFAERLDAVVQSLSQQKTICKHLLDAPYLNRFLDDPIGSRQRVESNRKLNKKKGGVMDVGKKALGMGGKKGRPSGAKRSSAFSDDDAEENGSEYKADSSDISSSPFRTPDRPIVRHSDSSGPPSVRFNPMYPGGHYRSETPTPASRRRRAVTSNTLSPMRVRNAQSPFGERHGSLPDSNPDRGRRYHSASLNTLPGSMVDPRLMPYNDSHSYNMMQTTGSANLFDNANSPYIQTPSSTYNSAYGMSALTTAGPTSAPFQASEPATEPLPGNSPRIKSPESEKEITGSDEEYLPSSARKRRRHNR